MAWTESDVPDQSGQTAVVTGANSGIGFETTRVLADRGATVIMAVRSLERGREAAEDIRSSVPDADLVLEELDLASLESVRAFADRLGAVAGAVDRLINNAGVMAIPRRETADGFEMQFGVNHLGHFALTGLVLEELAADARVVTVSSGVHENGAIDFDDLHGERSYDEWDAYAQSKLANLLFAYELHVRLEEAGSDVTSLAAHPGYADTGLQARGPRMAGSTVRLAFMRIANALFAQSAAKGALPILYAATAPDAEGCEYYGPSGLFDMRGPPERQRSSDRSYDRATAIRLWEVSSDLTDVEFPLPEPTAGREATG